MEVLYLSRQVGADTRKMVHLKAMSEKIAFMWRYLSGCIFVIASLQLLATHQRAGEITYTAISELKYEFKIVTYTYTPSPADRPELTINWGDGTSTVAQRTQKINYPNNISRNVYAGIQHTFPGPGTYLITLEDPNRNYGVLNIPNSVNVPFFLQTELVINPFLGPNNSVQLLAPPIDNGCVNSIYLHNPVAYDADGDSISYKLTICRGANGLPIPGYIFPNQVYTLQPTSFSIDPTTGTILWDKPKLQGEYNVAFLIEEWRYGVRIGYVTRDMQITITACSNQPPQIAPINDQCIVVGDNLSFVVQASDPDGNFTILRALGGPLILPQNPAVFLPAFGQGQVQSTFSWTPGCQHVQFQPYQVVFLAKDTLTFPQLLDIKTVNIKVISPPPTNLTSTPVGNTVHLNWNPLVCPQVIGYEIYRRNGFYGYIPQPCETGVPTYTGYSKIATVNGHNNTFYIDDNSGTGLIHGIDYCYMVVGVFPDGSKSKASNESCTVLKMDVPVITNVSVEVTDQNNGSMYIAWSKPSELDTLLFTPPYKYIVRRATGQNPGNFESAGINFSLNDTLFFDHNLNTTELPYIYKVDFFGNYSGIETYIGSTQIAWSMFLEISPTDQALNLKWNSNVPWQINYFTIFRKNPGSAVFDSVGTSFTNTFTDPGLVNGQVYTYKIRSTGYYSAPGIVFPIINFSQIVSAVPKDNVPPCKQNLRVTTNCDTMENLLEWSDSPACPDDISRFLLFYTPLAGQDPELIATIYDPAVRYYLHTGLFSIAGCYSVVAVDSTGNQSEMSEIVCVDITQCGTYRLPNVFTPNGDQQNDYFKAFPFTSVQSINLTIYNRWGRVMYQTTNPYFQWDGRNQANNKECPEGVYFYVCEVYEYRLEGLSRRTITGSVTLLR